MWLFGGCDGAYIHSVTNKRSGYKFYEREGYKIITNSTGWREEQNEVLLYTISDYVEPPLYDAVAKKNAWREYLKELDAQKAAAEAAAQ